ncbi:hypothetical protein ACRAWC_16350 [Leifsonia sp. L25]|uniref:hypothetical protein n=1 Tax=Actinomycetes TaxID=1760 RepID=UPI003D68EF64
MTIAVKAARPLPQRSETRVRHSVRTASAPGQSEHLAWRQPVAGLWVAETPSAYLGMIEQTDDGFTASAGDGRSLGSFAALADAKIAVYANWFRPQKTGLIGWLLRRA